MHWQADVHSGRPHLAHREVQIDEHHLPRLRYELIAGVLPQEVFDAPASVCRLLHLGRTLQFSFVRPCKWWRLRAWIAARQQHLALAKHPCKAAVPLYTWQGCRCRWFAVVHDDVRQLTCCTMGEDAESAEASALCMSTSPGPAELADCPRPAMADVRPVCDTEGCCCRVGAWVGEGPPAPVWPRLPLGIGDSCSLQCPICLSHHALIAHRSAASKELDRR